VVEVEDILMPRDSCSLALHLQARLPGAAIPIPARRSSYRLPTSVQRCANTS